MTDMRRVSFVISDDIDRRILALRKQDDYSRLSYSEILRRALASGLGALEVSPTQKPGDAPRA